MIRFVPWSEVGTITVSPGDNVVEVGAFELAEGADTLWVRMTNTGTPGPWPWSYGILSFKTEEGQPLGSIKAYNSFDGEVFRLGVGLPPSVRAGVLTFEPRGFNMAWIKQGNPWSLKFEAQAGTSGGGHVTSFWSRDGVNGVLSPATPGDDVALGAGELSGSAAFFTGDVAIGGTPLDPNINLRADGVSEFSNTLKAVNAATAATATLAFFGNANNTTNHGKVFITGQALYVGNDVSNEGNANIALKTDGSASFAGPITAPNVSLLIPATFRTARNQGSLDLTDEIIRLEKLVGYLYEKLRLTPPFGWEVWDGSDDIKKSSQGKHHI